MVDVDSSEEEKKNLKNLVMMVGWAKVEVWAGYPAWAIFRQEPRTFYSTHLTINQR